MNAADAIRKVTAIMQAELDAGRRSGHIDAHDLVDILLAIADEIATAPNFTDEQLDRARMDSPPKEVFPWGPEFR
jgi:hypothetical protein